MNDHERISGWTIASCCVIGLAVCVAALNALCAYNSI